MGDAAEKYFADDAPINTEFDAYQRHVANTAQLSNDQNLEFFALGVADETGEFCGKVKKWMRGDFTLDAEHRELMAKELGDIIWYIARCADKLGYSFSDIARLNNEKLADRRARKTVRGDGDVR